MNNKIDKIKTLLNKNDSEELKLIFNEIIGDNSDLRLKQDKLKMLLQEHSDRFLSDERTSLIFVSSLPSLIHLILYFNPELHYTRILNGKMFFQYKNVFYICLHLNQLLVRENLDINLAEIIVTVHNEYLKSMEKFTDNIKVSHE